MKQYQYYSNISPGLSTAVLNCCLAGTFTVKRKMYVMLCGFICFSKGSSTTFFL